MEACGSAALLGAPFPFAQGHAVRLLPARDVRPYVRRNKTDRADAAGLIEAARCGRSTGAGEVAAATRDAGVAPGARAAQAQRTAAINLVQGSAASSAWPYRPARPNCPRPCVPRWRTARTTCRWGCAPRWPNRWNGSHRSPATWRRSSAPGREAEQDVAVQRYQTLPGVGLLTATALRAGAGDLSRFRSGRHLAAWLGLVPREHSSGQQRRLGKITKRGDSYLRTLLIHGGRARSCGRRACDDAPASCSTVCRPGRSTCSNGRATTRRRSRWRTSGRRLWRSITTAPPSIRTTSAGGRSRP